MVCRDIFDFEQSTKSINGVLKIGFGRGVVLLLEGIKVVLLGLRLKKWADI